MNAMGRGKRSRLRWLVLCFVALAAGRLVVTTLPATGSWSARRSDLRTQRERQLSLLRQRAAVASEFSSAIARRERRRDQVVEAPTAERAVEVLASTVLAHADSSGVRLEAVTPMYTQDAESAQSEESLMVSAVGTGALSEVGWWLSSIEAGAPLMRIRSLDLLPQDVDGTLMLRVEATIVAPAVRSPTPRDGVVRP